MGIIEEIQKHAPLIAISLGIGIPIALTTMALAKPREACKPPPEGCPEGYIWDPTTCTCIEEGVPIPRFIHLDSPIYIDGQEYEAYQRPDWRYGTCQTFWTNPEPIPLKTALLHGKVVDAIGRGVPNIPLYVYCSKYQGQSIIASLQSSEGLLENGVTVITDNNGEFWLDIALYIPWETLDWCHNLNWTCYIPFWSCGLAWDSFIISIYAEYSSLWAQAIVNITRMKLYTHAMIR
jgi:hypothetical protein